MVMSPVPTAMAAQMATNRISGEVEALEGLGIDPYHFLVVPRSRRWFHFSVCWYISMWLHLSGALLWRYWVNNSIFLVYEISLFFSHLLIFT